MERIVIDLDGTLTIDDASVPYAERAPRLDVIQKLRDYKASGFLICVMTARNMRTFEGNLGQINVHTLPAVIDWLRRHDVPFDEVLMGKPWCGKRGFYVDDRALRPDEFAKLSLEEVSELFDSDPTN